MNEDQLWNQVAAELKRGELDDGLWLKVRTLIGGTKEEAERAYVLARIEQLKQDRERERKKISASTWQEIQEVLKTRIPDMDHIPHENFLGSKDQLDSPTRASTIAERLDAIEFEVIDGIKSRKIKGVYDGEIWWAEARGAFVHK